MSNEEKLSAKEVRAISALLTRLDPGYVPYPIFEQLARIMALPIVEFIPLRLGPENKVEVLLIERPPEDTLFRDMLHTPGTVIRATDVVSKGGKNWSAFERILQDELQGVEVSDLHYVGSIFHASKRGAEQAQLYWLEVVGTPKVGQFYPVDNLPPNLIESQRDFIYQSAKSFQTYNAAQG
jgi:hypothetical protein